MRKAIIYAEISKEAAYNKGVEIGLTGEELSVFTYFNEVKLEIEIDDEGIVRKITAIA